MRHDAAKLQGYPGTVEARVVYLLTDGGSGATGRLRCLFTATTDAPTVVSMVQHSCWNLGGHSSGDVLGHRLIISACEPWPSCATSDARQTVYTAAGGAPHRLQQPANELQDVGVANAIWSLGLLSCSIML